MGYNHPFYWRLQPFVFVESICFLIHLKNFFGEGYGIGNCMALSVSLSHHAVVKLSLYFVVSGPKMTNKLSVVGHG